MGAARWLAGTALLPALSVGQLPLIYRTGFGTGPERSCPVPQRAGRVALAQRQPGVLGYYDSCDGYGISPSMDVLNRLDVGVQNITILSPSFGNHDLRALVMLLLDRDGFYLSRVRSLDFSRAHLDASSMLLVAQLLLHPGCKLELLDLSFQQVGLEGACAVGSSVRVSRSLRTLRLHTCALYDEGGQVMLDLLRNTSLQTVDLQNNFMEFVTCQAILEVSKEKDIDVDLAGNRVLDEIWNAVTHGIGVGLGIAGMVALLVRVRGKPAYFKYSIVIYGCSAILLYLFSTLYHSFFSLGRATVNVFQLLDFCGIFLLIAGSYTPFVVILFHGEWWATLFIRGMWVSAILGMAVAAFYHGPGEVPLHLTMFLGMGWAAVVVMKSILKELGHRGAALLITGGVLYSAGVPFFVRNERVWDMPDHAIWHLFVLAASTCHFFAIYFYVAPRKPNEEVAAESGLGEKLVSREEFGSDSSDDEDTLKSVSAP